MDCLIIEGSKPLAGRVEIPPAKNAALPLMCLSLLTDEKVVFERLPNVEDIRSLREVLKGLGVRSEDGSFHCPTITSVVAPYDWVRKMRASILVLGPLVARAGEAQVSLPGGCAIGERPVDIHLKGLEALGADIKVEEGYIKARVKPGLSRLKGTRFVCHFPSVTGTINLVGAAALADGETVLENVAREPEVVEVCEALAAMGAQIVGAGTDRLHIQGVARLKGMTWKIQPDRIQLLTYLASAAITGGTVECHPYRRDTLNSVLQKFSDMGCQTEELDGSVRLSGPARLKATTIETAPFPGFPTDAQAQFMACAAVADGVSPIRESVFENRFGHVGELRRMGADIDVKGNLALVKGVSMLSGATVMASDLRASASLVLAALRAQGTSRVRRIYHLDRGYESFEQKLSSLGATIRRESE